MKYHKEQIVKMIIGLVIFTLLAAGGVFLLMHLEPSGLGKVKFVIIAGVVFFGLGAVLNVRGVIKTIGEYNDVRQSGLLEILATVNPYKTHEEMFAAFKEEKPMPIYQDEQILLTKRFLGQPKGKFVLLLDGILDAKIVVRRTNGVVERVDLEILYYDGEKTSFEYERPMGVSGSSVMQKKIADLEAVIHFMDENGKCFRTHEACRL